MVNFIKGDLLLILATAIWGISFPLMRNLSRWGGVMNLVTLRFIIASIFLYLIFYKKVNSIDMKNLIFSFFNGLLLMLSFMVLAFGQTYASALNSSFIMGLTIVFVPLLASFILKKKLSKANLAAIVISLLGIFFISGGIRLSIGAGEIIIFASMLLFSCHIVQSDHFISKGADTVTVGVMQNVCAALLSIPIWLVTGIGEVEITRLVIIQLIVLGVFCTAIAFTLMICAQKYMPPSRVGLILGAEPVFGAVFSVIIPDFNGIRETFYLHHLIGSIFIISAIIISEIFSSKQKLHA
ncbi:MAG: EamA family transporter [Clostridia bacterium]|nr:EamA family transporter [Clostridia bacterium]